MNSPNLCQQLPNASPNASRTHFPNAPELNPNAPDDTRYILRIIKGAAVGPARPHDGWEPMKDGRG